MPVMVAPLPPAVARKGRVGIILGSVLMAVAAVVFVVSLVFGISATSTRVSGFDRARAGGTVHLDRGTLNVYAEYPGASDDDFAQPMVARPVLVREGTPVALRMPGHSENYKFGSHEGRLIGKVHIEQAGTYQVTADGGTQPVTYAFGTGVTGSIVALAVGVGGSILVFMVGAVVLIIGLVRRSRNRNANVPWGAPAPGGRPAWAATPVDPSAGPPMVHSRMPPPPGPPGSYPPPPPDATNWPPPLRPDPGSPPPLPPNRPPAGPGFDGDPPPPKGPIS